jgi:hypothetical protein
MKRVVVPGGCKIMRGHKTGLAARASKGLGLNTQEN